jgi:hypothetical protein
VRTSLHKLSRLRRQQWLDLGRAAYELALARWKVSHTDANELLGVMRSQGVATRPIGEMAERVAFAIPRVASRVPWRANCLVQALAARRWLRRAGIASQIHLGVRKPTDDLDAHAWLTCGDRIITGGDVAEYVPFAQDRTDRTPRRP